MGGLPNGFGYSGVLWKPEYSVVCCEEFPQTNIAFFSSLDYWEEHCSYSLLFFEK